MKITVNQLRKIIKEEVRRNLQESAETDYDSLARAWAAAEARYNADDSPRSAQAASAAEAAFMDAFINAIKGASMEMSEEETERALNAAENAGVNTDGEMGWHLEFLASKHSK